MVSSLFAVLLPDCLSASCFTSALKCRHRQLHRRANQTSTKHHLLRRGPSSGSSSVIRLDSTSPLDAKKRAAKAARCLSQKHLTNHIHKQLKTPSPAPINGSLQRLISSASTPPEPPGTLIPNAVTHRCLDSVSFTAERGRETISYTPRASLKAPRQHASAPPDATASPHP